MLARSFKTATELNLTEEEHGALIQVLYALERGELKHAPDSKFGNFCDIIPRPTLFHMRMIFGESDCGTTGCILGWAKTFARNHRLFQGNFWGMLGELFGYDRPHIWDATPEQAAQALSNYLTTGAPRWDEIIPTPSKENKHGEVC
jgi:hypothetical protein